MDWFLAPFLNNEFLLRSLAAGILVALCCAVVGTFVVLRGLAFIGDALAHGVLPGIAVALLLGLPGIVGAAAGAAVMIGGISLLTHRTRLSTDTAIGLLFVGMLALGVLIVSRSSSFSGDLVRVLFGEILGISPNAILLQAAATAGVAAAAWLCARPFLLLCYSAEQAQVSGFSARRYHAIMLSLVALTVIVSFQTVGTLLVFGMLLAPAGAGALLARRIGGMMGWAAVFGAVSVYAGLLVSYHFRVAAGSAIVLCATLLFFAVFALRNVRPEDTPGAPALPSRSGTDAGRGSGEAVAMPPLPSRPSRFGRGSPVLRAKDLSVGYDSSPVVSGITLELQPGEALALVGMNGSGKSTLLKTISGLLPPVAGMLEAAGAPPGRAPRRIGYLSQQHQSALVLPLRAIDIVRMGRFSSLGLLGRMRAEDHELVRAAMEAMGVSHLAGAALRSLSGGQQQRVYLAQALARHADLLVLDEPTSGLDAAGRELYRRAMAAERARGAAVVVATHDIQEATACGQAMLLARRVVAFGPADEVLTPEALLETFGVILRAGGVEVLEHEHSHE